MLNDYKNNLNLFYFFLEHQSFSKKPDSIFTRNEKIFNHPLLQDYLGKSFCNFLLALNSLFKNKQFQDRASMLMSVELNSILFDAILSSLFHGIHRKKFLLSNEDKNKLKSLLISMFNATRSFREIVDCLSLPKFSYSLWLAKCIGYPLLFVYYISFSIFSPVILFFGVVLGKSNVAL